jgi:hypothetical protein
LLKKADAYHSRTLTRPALTGAVRVASYVAYRGLELTLGARHPHGRVLAQARALQTTVGAPRPAPGGPRVLFFTVRGWYVHSALQAVLAKALEQRGASARFVLCRGGFSQCDFKPATDHHVTPALCWRCRGFTDELLSRFELPHFGLDELDVERLQAHAASCLAGLGRKEYESFTYQGLPLFEWCLPSIRRTLLRGDAGSGPLSDAVVRGYLESGIVYVEVVRRLLDREQPDVCIVVNGLFHAERIFREIAHARGVRVVSYEQGWRPLSFHFVEDAAAAHFPVDDLWQATREHPLSDEQSKTVDTYLAERTKGGGVVSVYWPKMDGRREALSRRIGIDPDKPMAVLFPNITWDSATFRLDRAFSGLSQWIEATIHWFETQPDKQLVIRVHPAEVRLPMMESRDALEQRIRTAFPNLPANVRVVPADDPANSYELLAMSEAVLVYTSTLGMEAAAQGRRVLVAGTPHYAGRGFTDGVVTADDYGRNLTRAFDEPHLSEAQRDLARRYVYLLIYNYMISFPWVVDTPRSARRLQLSSLSELAPGRDADLDRLCRAILEGTPFYAAP